jgi:hypothetical protein
MIRQFYDYRRKSALVAATANRSAPTAFSGFWTAKPESSTGISAWNAVPAPQTARWMLFTLTPTTAVAARHISLTAGSPDFAASPHPAAANIKIRLSMVWVISETTRLSLGKLHPGVNSPAGSFQDGA